MRKLFTLTAALLASFCLWAVVPTGTLNPADVPTTGWAGKYTPAYIENGDWVCFSPYEIYQSTQTWAAKDASGSTSGSWDAADPFPASSAWTNDGKVATVRTTEKGPYYYRITNTTDVAIMAKSGSDKKRTIYLEAYELTAGVAGETPTKTATMEANSNTVISVSELDATKEYLIVVRQTGTGSNGSSDGNSNYNAIAFKTIMSTEPSLNATPASIDLEVTSVKPSVSETVTFTGKNLTAGTYNLDLSEVAGLSVNPTSVTVGDDGKLNATVTVTYTSSTDVAAASGTLVLNIGALTQTVTVNYSAVLAKEYGTSVNIEQLVLDNGTGYNIKSAFAAAHIDYADIDALDTLNDLENKTNRNYAFLGLKLKKATATVGCWVKAGSTIRVRFGNVGADFKVALNGTQETKTNALANTSVESDKVLEFTASEDTYAEIICNSTKTLVIKQIMIDEAIAAVTLPTPNAFLVNVTTPTNGTLAANWPNKKYRTPVGETVTLTVTPADGYEIDAVTLDGDELVPAAGVYSFVMPAKEVTVAATFKEIAAAGCDWDNLAFIADGATGADQTYANQFKICVGDPAPGIDIIQNPGWATAPGIYITFPSAAFGNISLAEGQYDIQGAGMLLHVAAFTLLETEVTIVCDNNDYIFTVYNAKGVTTAIENNAVVEKAVKFIENGQLFIEKNGVRYNAQGAIVK